MFFDNYLPNKIILNKDRRAITIKVSNKGDRPIQVGSHYHFAETNDFLDFDRDVSKGMRLNIPSGTAVRFEPGQTKDVELNRLLSNSFGFGGTNACLVFEKFNK